MENGITYLRPLNQIEKNAAQQFTHKQRTLSEFLETIQEESFVYGILGEDKSDVATFKILIH